MYLIFLCCPFFFSLCSDDVSQLQVRVVLGVQRRLGAARQSHRRILQVQQGAGGKHNRRTVAGEVGRQRQAGMSMLIVCLSFSARVRVASGIRRRRRVRRRVRRRPRPNSIVTCTTTSASTTTTSRSDSPRSSADRPICAWRTCTRAAEARRPGSTSSSSRQRRSKSER